MPCTYTYKSKTYESKDDLKEAIIEDIINKPLTTDKNSFVITGEKSELEFQELVLKGEAQRLYGTDEFISTNLNGNQLEINIDGGALEDLVKAQGGEKLLFNEDAGKTEVFDIKDLIEKEKNGDKIPTIRNWVSEKGLYYGNLIFDNIWNAKVDTPANKSDLKTKLYSFCQYLGISITTIENWMRDNADRIGSDTSVEALADMLTRTIALSNENNISQLSEEVGHFGIEYSLHEPMVQRMLAQVHNTNIWATESGVYKLKYGEQLRADGTKLTKEELEKKVRKEILGKILADKIKDNFNTETAQNSAEIGIFTQLKNLWQRFINLFKITNENKKFFVEFGSVLDQLANQVLNVEEDKFVPWESKEVYFSMGEKPKTMHDRIEDVMQRLKVRYKNIIDETSISAGKRRTLFRNIEEALTYNKYAQALNSIISIFENDITRSVDHFNTAKQQGGELSDNIKISDVLNANSFGKNFKTFRGTILGEIENLRELKDENGNPIIRKEEADDMENRVKNAGKLYSSIENELSRIIEKVGNNLATDVYKQWGADESVQKEVSEKMTAGFFDNISTFKELTFSFARIGNPIFTAIHILVANAERIREIVSSNFGANFAKIVKKHNLQDSLVRKLYDGFNMINPLHTHNLERYLSVIEDEYKTKIENAKTPDEKLKLTEELHNLLNKQNEEWLHQPVLKERMAELNKLSSGARNAILDKAASKKKILDKYRLSDNTVPFENVSDQDWLALEKIESDYKETADPYRRDGAMKDGADLKTAHDLMNYKNSIVDSAKKAEYRDEDFQKEVKEQGIDFKHPENFTDKQKKWLQANAIHNYSKKDQEKIDNGGSTEVDADVMDVVLGDNKEAFIDEILGYKTEEGNFSNLDINYKDSKGNRQTELPNSNDIYDKNNFQAIYESLLQKRLALVAPYKKIGKIGEIDGNLIEKNDQLKDSLETTTRQLQKFKLEYREDITILTEGNDAYNQRLKELKNNPNALNKFKHDIAKVRRFGQDEVPTVYHYRRAVVADIDKNKFQKEYMPNLKWQVNNETKSFYNPDYNRKLAGKTLQLRLDNPKLKEKIPQEVIDKLAKLKKHPIEVAQGATYEDLFINKDFYDTFGIDRQNDFWGLEKGATINEGLWKLRDFVLSEKQKVDDNYNVKNKLYQLPQTQATFRELRTRGVYDTLRSEIGHKLLDENNDVVIGDKDRITVPKRFLHKLPRPELISTDLSRLYGLYLEHGTNYIEKNKILPKIQILQERLLNSTVGDSKDVAGTKLFRMLDRWLSVHIYGNLVDELGGVKAGLVKLSETTPALSFLGKISPAKFVYAIYNYMRDTNLGLHTIVPVVNLINTAVNTTMEHLSDNQVNKDSLGWAAQKIGRYYGQHVLDSGKILPNTHIMKLLRYSNIHISPAEIYDGISKNMLYRVSDNPLYITYRPASILSASQAVFSIFDGYRLIDGEFRNINNFRDFRRKANSKITDKELDNEWKTYRTKSYYSFLEDKGNQITINKTRLENEGFLNGLNSGEKENKIKQLEARIAINAQRFWNRTELQSTPLEKPLLYSKIETMFFGLHSQWFFSFLTNKFQSRDYNLFENRWEEGIYTTVWRLTKDILSDQEQDPFEKMKSFMDMMGSGVTFGAYRAGLNGLSESEKTNVIRSMSDMVMWSALFSLFLLANASADDSPDDWLKNYLALLATRSLLETSSQMGQPFEIAQKIANPIPGMTLLDNFINIPFLLFDWDSKVKSGIYKGDTKLERSLWNLSFMKNLYGLHDINKYRGANIYYRNNVPSSLTLPNLILKKYEGKKK